MDNCPLECPEDSCRCIGGYYTNANGDCVPGDSCPRPVISTPTPGIATVPLFHVVETQILT